ncbi:MAG: HlyD family efflux transporter periplasmic adaptor subunit [Rhizobiaceae bacterium]
MSGTVAPQGVTPAQKKVSEEEAAEKARILRLEALLLFEGELRQTQTVRELSFCIANEARKVVPARQIYMLKPVGSKGARLQIDVVSNLSSVDKNAPAVRWLENIFTNALGPLGETPLAFEMPVSQGDEAAVFPFRYGVLVPLLDKRKKLFGVIAFLSEQPFNDGDIAVLGRLQQAIEHAWLALAPRPLRRVSSVVRKSIGLLVLAAAVCAMFIPVPMSSLAPVEVVAQSAQVVAAPLDGVIEVMLVEPNTRVSMGQVLFRFVDTELSSRHAIANRSLNVAQAKLQTARQNAFGSGEGRRDLAVAKAELALAETELSYAVDQLAKTIVRSPVSGLVVFDRKTDWQGRPVAVGERVVEVADPELVEYRIDLPVSDAIVLRKDARVKVFLDSAPLNPREAILRVASYRATISPDEQLVYKTYAVAASKEERPARIGARGTGQVFGEQVSLGFYLFRRPLSAIRQYTGW